MVSFRTRVAGIYRARYTGTSVRTLTDQDTGDEVQKWLWLFQEVADSTTAGEVSKWTGTDPKSPNSNAHKMLAGVMGRKPQDGDDTDTMVGKLYDVVYGPNQAGNLTITSVVLVAEPSQPVQDAPEAAAAPQVAPVTAEADGGPALDF
jgi:hypothetical protein